MVGKSAHAKRLSKVDEDPPGASTGGHPRLKLLNGFAFEIAQVRVQLPLGMQRLVAYLALKGPGHRCVVAGTLWPEVPEVQALASLRTGVWRMNRMVPGCIVSERMTLATSQGMSIDSREQELLTTRLMREQVDDEQWITERLDILWQAELLPGWYDDWVVLERERLSQLRLHALERTAMMLARRHHVGAALQLALEAVRTEPLRETANATLIAVYLAEGNLSTAIHHYKTFRRLMQRELGVEPSDALSQMLPRQGGW